jgi:hypothetical protein
MSRDLHYKLANFVKLIISPCIQIQESKPCLS